MAEVVERNLEDTLGEILHIKKAKLFNKSEINEVIRKRRQHEYALQKRNKRVLDYDSFITTELTILKLLRFRRQKSDDRRYIDKIERSIISRVVRLHRQLCYRFQSRVDVWIRFINFCKILGRHVSAVRVWNRLLQVHGRTDPRLWAAAASYHLHQNAKAKLRTGLRKLDKEAKELTEQKRKLQIELKTLTRFLDQKKQEQIAETLADLRGTRSDLNQTVKHLARERRLLHDRVTLQAIREARRLLTEGLTLNPQCKLLLIELAKLEACAADFFRNRVIERVESQPDDAMDVDSEKPVGKRRKQVPKSVAEDNVCFMADITEDVNFVASGEAFRLVAESILDQCADDRWSIENLQQLLNLVPQLVQDSSLQSRLQSTLEKLDSQPKTVERNEKLPTVSTKNDIKILLDERITQLYNTVQNDGLPKALDLWDSWYSSGVRTDEFRFLDPELSEAVALLRLRLQLCSLQLSRLGDGSTEERLVQSKELIQRTRTWLDALSTSPWGQKSPDFWVSYAQFERTAGDCTRVPAVLWRASKTLLPSAYMTFTNLLNGSQ